MMRIGHVALTTPDLDRAVAFAEQILGLRVSERAGDTAYLTCNGRHHELQLIRGEQAACHHIAIEVDDLGPYRHLPQIEHERERGVADSLRVAAPGGFTLELFTGMAHDQPPAYPTTGVRPKKFEHVTVKSSVKDELEAFLVEVVGLRLSDRAEDAISWLRASDEHHGMSVIRADADLLHHYAWQVDGWDAIRRVGDRIMLDDGTFLWGPGHHGIGDNYFCYFHDADGAIVEYSGDIQRIEDEASYVPRVWPDEPRSVNRWGNPPPPPEFLAGGIPHVSLPTPRRVPAAV